MKSYLKILGINLLIFYCIFFNNSYAQFLENVVHTALVDNNYYNIEVMQQDIDKIILKGSVDTYYDKIWINETVLRIPGVREVSNHLIVDNPSVPDDILKNNISEGLSYISSVNESQINVEVKKGIVFLSGDVTYPDEKNTAHKIASLHEGVRGIVNQIKVQPESQTFSNNNLQTFLKGLINERYPDEKEINVTVKNGEVILKGKVSSNEIKEGITDNLTKISGVKKVTNDLEINSAPDSKVK